MTSRLCLLLVLLWLPACSSTPAPPTDAAIVHCTATPQRATTVEAAIALRLVEPSSREDNIVVAGKNVTFDEWRTTDPSSFGRACAAVAEPVMRPATVAPPNVLLTALAGLIPILAGAAIAWYTANWRDERNRGNQQADALRTASRAYLTAVRDFCDAQLKGTPDNTPPSATDARHRRDDLVAQLISTAALRGRWTAPAILRTQLDGMDIESGWDFEQHRNERRPRADEVNTAVNELDRRIDVVVRALERRGRPHRELRTEFTAVGP